MKQVDKIANHKKKEDVPTRVIKKNSTLSGKSIKCIFTYLFQAFNTNTCLLF